MAQTEEAFIVQVADGRGLHRITVSPEEYAMMLHVGVPVYEDHSVQRPLELPPVPTDLNDPDVIAINGGGQQ